MPRTHLVIPDSHAHPDHHNERATWLGRLIREVRPDVVIHLGDSADMPSLSSYDKGTLAFEGRRYKHDINAHLDFQDRLWHEVKKAKKKLPERHFIIGNHEQRIERAIQKTPELAGTMSYDDLRLRDYYDEVYPYVGSTPAVCTVDGVAYAHYFVTGVSGRSISGEHTAYTLINKHYHSCTAGHNHLLDLCIRHDVNGKPLMGLTAGCYVDYSSSWAGELNKMWWKGVIVKHDVDNGVYSPEMISLERIRKQYDWWEPK